MNLDPKRAEPAIRSARRVDAPAVAGLLATCGLPTAGVIDHLAEGYAVAVVGDALIGVAGVEVHGGLGLLRSVAVEPTWQGRGVGTRLVDDRMAWAGGAGLPRVFLLTIDAAGYFESRGFTRIDRTEAPVAIQACPEFALLCPQSAIVMATEVPLGARPHGTRSHAARLSPRTSGSP